MQHFYVQFPSVGTGPDGKAMSMEPRRWKRVLCGEMLIGGYDPSRLLCFTQAVGPSSDPRSLNLRVNDDVTAEDLRREFPTAEAVGPFTPDDSVVWESLPMTTAA